MKKFSLLLNILLICATVASAQYTTYAKIEYERKVNIYAQMEEMGENEWFDRMKSQIPKFSSTYFDMIFDTARCIYKPGRESPNAFKMFGGGPATGNVVLTDFRTKKVVANKAIYEQKFLVQDSPFLWRSRCNHEVGGDTAGTPGDAQRYPTPWEADQDLLQPGFRIPPSNEHGLSQDLALALAPTDPLEPAGILGTGREYRPQRRLAGGTMPFMRR